MFTQATWRKSGKARYNTWLLIIIDAERRSLLFCFLFFSQVKPAISEQAYCALVIPTYAQSI